MVVICFAHLFAVSLVLPMLSGRLHKKHDSCSIYQRENSISMNIKETS